MGRDYPETRRYLDTNNIKVQKTEKKAIETALGLIIERRCSRCFQRGAAKHALVTNGEPPLRESTPPHNLHDLDLIWGNQNSDDRSQAAYIPSTDGQNCFYACNKKIESFEFFPHFLDTKSNAFDHTQERTFPYSLSNRHIPA